MPFESLRGVTSKGFELWYTFGMNQLLIERLKIAGFIFALVGWLLLVTVPLELIGKDLSKLEGLFETTTFKWSLRIVVLVAVIFLIKGKSWVDGLFVKYSWLKKLVRVITVVGAIGWIVGLGSLLLR